MYSKEELLEIATIQRTTIQNLEQYSIPVTPENYTLWYKYMSGVDDTLSTEIDEIIKNKIPFDSTILSELYEKFCSSSNAKELEKLRDDLQHLVSTLTSSLSEIVGSSDTISSFLYDSTKELDHIDSVEDFRDILTTITNKIEEFKTENQKTQQQFLTAQEEMQFLRTSLTKLKEESRTDELTGIQNRRAFGELFEKAISLAKRKKRPLSLLIIDIDKFKNVNDTFGHLIGDEILKFVSRRIQDRIRKEDTVCRFGGEEFTVILPETSLENAAKLAETIRAYFSSTILTRESEPRNIGTITISVGVAQLKDDESGNEFINRADSNLYKAKNSGRNKVIM